MQQFKKMIGFSMYEISNNGTIRKVVTKQIISQRLHPGYGYKMCDLQDNDLKVRTVYPHKEVARAFIPTRKKGKLYVIHKNGNQQDNRTNNLEWATPAEAQVHQLKVGFRKRLGNPELYKFSKFWKARNKNKSKKGAKKNIKKIDKKSSKNLKASKNKKNAAVKKSIKLRKGDIKPATIKKKSAGKKVKAKISNRVGKKTKPAAKNIAVKKIAGIKKPLNSSDPKRGKRQRIKYKKVHSTRLK
jgi:hypothetical protein